MARCPIEGCSAERKHGMVLCQDHWFNVPATIRDRVWSTHKLEPGSDDHLDAVKDAIQAARDVVMRVTRGRKPMSLFEARRAEAAEGGK